MRAYLISDNHDTLVGLRLAGIDGVVVHGAHDTSRAMTEALLMEDIAIVAITELAASLIPDKINVPANCIIKRSELSISENQPLKKSCCL